MRQDIWFFEKNSHTQPEREEHMEAQREVRVAPRNWREYLREARETARMYQWVWKELATDRGRYWLKRAGAMLLVAAVFQVVQPRLVSYIFDGLVRGSTKLILLGLGGFFGCLGVQKIADYYHFSAREWLLGTNWGRLDQRITELFFEKSMGQHIQESSVLNVGNIDKGRWKVLELHGMLLFEGVPALSALFLSYMLLWFLSPVAGIAMTIVIGVYLLWMLFLNQKVMEVCTSIDYDFRRLNRHRVERWEKVERVKTCGKGVEELTEMDEVFNRVIGRDRAFWLWFIKQCTFRGTVNMLGLTFIMGYGAWLVWSGEWTIGLLYPLYGWSMRVSESIWRIGDIEHMLNWNMPSVKALIEALSLPPDIVDRDGAVEFQSAAAVRVVFAGVSYTYPRHGREEAPVAEKSPLPVLKCVSFEIRPGEKVAVIGASGAGKTTIMRLLLRYMDPDGGSIRVNGCDLRNLALDSWMRHVGYIPQQTQILDGTIRYNLTYSLSPSERATISDAELWEVMRLLRIDFGSRLVDGLETRVGRNGIKLSGGEAQRLMIGAAAIKRPPFMIIDEATSNLDSSTEKAVQEGLAEVLRGNTSALVVAHRLSTVRGLCNKFVVLRGIEEVDGHESQVEAIAVSFEELFAVSPTFRRLAEDQGIFR